MKVHAYTMIRGLSKKSSYAGARDEVIELLYEQYCDSVAHIMIPYYLYRCVIFIMYSFPIRSSVADWNGAVPSDSVLLSGKSLNFSDEGKSVPLLPSQISLLRALLWGFLNQRGKGERYEAKAFDSKKVVKIEHRVCVFV